MSLRWILFVALRYFRSARKKRSISTSALAVAGIAVGVMALIAVLGVMNGFQLGTIEAILEVNSYHLRVDAAPGEVEGGEAGAWPESVLHAAGELDAVRAALPFLDVQAIGRGLFSSSQVIFLRGLPSNAMELDPGFADTVEVESGAFDLRGTQQIVLGAELARSLGADTGSIVQMVNLSGPRLNALRPEEISFLVVGTFRSGFWDYDRSWAFISLETAQALAGNADELVVGLKLQDRFADRRVMAELDARLDGAARVESWREYNRSIFGALRLEKTLMLVLLGIIFVVVGASIYQSLRRTVVERREEIALLKALGASPRGVRAVFLFDGAFIGFVGASLGTVLGLLVSEHINEIFEIAELVARAMAALLGRASGPAAFSSDYFYIEEIPSSVLPGETLLIFMFAVVSSTAAAYLAGSRATRIRPAQVLRYE